METISLGHCVVDLLHAKVVWPDRTLPLSSADQRILTVLAHQLGEVVERFDLERQVWPDGAPPRALDHAVRRIRRKIEADRQRPRWLVTVRGVGFRLQGAAPRSKPDVDDRITLSDRVVDLEARTVRTVSTTYRLTPIEVDLLGYLNGHAGRIVPRSELLRRVWGYSANSSSRTIDSTLHRLRSKIEPNPSHPVHLETVPGAGYRFDPHVAGTPPTSLLGRSRLLQEVQDAWSMHRMVALVGPSGMGKTALVEHVAEASSAWGTDLVVIEDIDLDLETFVDWLETSWDPVNGPRLLVTSRVRWPCAVGVQLLVPPLGLPASRELFLREVGLENVDEAAFDRLMAWLDGIPLAIRAAAQRAKVLGVRELAERLPDQRTLLQSTKLPSFEEAFDQSWARLSVALRETLDGLAVFPKDFALPEAESVLGDSDAATKLLALVDAGWLYVELRAGHSRYRVPGPFRAFLEQRRPPTEPLLNRFIETYTQLTNTGAKAYRWGPEPAVALERLHVELPNLYAAHALARHRAPDSCARLANDVQCLLVGSDLKRFSEMADIAVRARPKTYLALALVNRAEARILVGQAASEVESDLDVAWSLAQEAGDETIQLSVLRIRAKSWWRQGHHTEALGLLEEALQRTPRNPLAHVLTYLFKAAVLMLQARGDAAERAVRVALMTAERHGSAYLANQMRNLLWRLVLADGRRDEALQLLETLYAHEETFSRGDRWVETVTGLATVNLQLGHIEKAERWLDLAESGYESTRSPDTLLMVRLGRCEALMRTHEWSKAWIGLDSLALDCSASTEAGILVMVGVYRGVVTYLLGDTAEALVILDETVAVAESRAGPLEVLGTRAFRCVLHHAVGQDREAFNDLEVCARVASSGAELGQLGGIWRLLASAGAAAEDLGHPAVHLFHHMLDRARSERNSEVSR
ncbi:MAG: winged helix-turn-helix domain-containing protein [Myxococcota bacterium]